MRTLKRHNFITYIELRHIHKRRLQAVPFHISTKLNRHFSDVGLSPNDTVCKSRACFLLTHCLVVIQFSFSSHFNYIQSNSRWQYIVFRSNTKSSLLTSRVSTRNISIYVDKLSTETNLCPRFISELHTLTNSFVYFIKYRESFLGIQCRRKCIYIWRLKSGISPVHEKSWTNVNMESTKGLRSNQNLQSKYIEHNNSEMISHQTTIPSNFSM